MDSRAKAQTPLYTIRTRNTNVFSTRTFRPKCRSGSCTPQSNRGRHLTFCRNPFIMRYISTQAIAHIPKAWKGTSNSPRYRTESSRQMRGARERTANTSRSRAPNEILYWFSVGCAGSQHPLSGWNKGGTQPGGFLLKAD